MLGIAARPRIGRRLFEINMIVLTRLNDATFVLNAELIKMIEATPDTLITLINGDHMMVRESVDDVVARAIDFLRQIRGFQVV